MTASEFKAWFEGYCEGIDGVPSPEQFERIKQKVAQLACTPPLKWVSPLPVDTGPRWDLTRYPPNQAFTVAEADPLAPRAS
ncbi:hypothetical protein QBK99_11090 [Corticibacterium sp. UT-5YL-CI-8]|nr:hypothetical protein [Tianweitania sp. UT-5YL-CI-8]